MTSPIHWAHQVRMIKRGCSRMVVASLFVRETYIQDSAGMKKKGKIICGFHRKKYLLLLKCGYSSLADKIHANSLHFFNPEVISSAAKRLYL